MDSQTKTAVRVGSAPMPRSSPATAPLTFQQEWLSMAMRKRDEWNFVTAFSWRLRGPLNITALHKSVCAVLQRHDALRTRIVSTDAGIVQRVDEHCESQLTVIDFTGSGATDLAEIAKDYLAEFFSIYFDLANGPIVKSRLVRMTPQDHVLAIATHHMVTDAISVDIMFREVWQSYQDFSRGRPSSLPHVPMQYADYAIQQRYKHPAWLAHNGEYWRAKLAGATTLRIPTDFAGDKAHSSDCMEHRLIQLGAALSAAISKLAQREGTTPAIVMLAMYACLLSRWCEQSDFVIPFIVAGREHSEQFKLIGYFAHALLLRLRLSGEETFLELLRSVSDEFVGAYEHVDSGRIIVEAPSLLGGTSVQWISSHPNEFREVIIEGDINNPGLSVGPFPVTRRLPWANPMDCDTSAAFWNTTEGIIASIRFRANIVSAISITRFCERFQSLAENAVLHPENRLSPFVR